MSVEIDMQKVPPRRLIIESNRSKGRIGSVVDARLYPHARIGCEILCSKADDGLGDAPFRAHIKYFVEPNAGAHYYVQSYYGASCESASCLLPLERCTVARLDGNRRAFLCLGVLMRGSRVPQCDIGLANDGAGWYPMSYCQNGSVCAVKRKNVLIYEADRPALLSASALVRLTVRIGRTAGEDILTGVYQITGEPEPFASIEYRAGAGGLFSGAGAPEAAFIRFMSLCPIGGASQDDADGSELRGELRELRLGGEPWKEERIQYAWAMQPENIPELAVSGLCPVSFREDMDRIHISHTVQTH